MRASERLAQRAQVVREFQQKFDALVELMDEEAHSAVLSKMVPKAGKEQEVRRLKREVAELSGRAAIAAEGLEQRIGVKAPGREAITLPVIQGWEYALDQPWLVQPDYLSECIGQAVGSLTEKAAAARARERSVAGRVAMFVGFPATVRSAVAAEHPSLGKAGFATGIVGQIVVAVVGGLVLFGATAGVTALWKSVVQTAPAPSPSVTPTPDAPASLTPAPSPSVTAK